MSYPPEGFQPLLAPPVYWLTRGANPLELQGYVCNPLKHSIGILVTEGERIGEVLHVDFALADYLEGLRSLLSTMPPEREGGDPVTYTTEVALHYDPERGGIFAALRADTGAIPMQAAVERVAVLKQQHEARMAAAKAEADRIVEAARLEAEADAKKIAEAVAAEPAESTPSIPRIEN